MIKHYVVFICSLIHAILFQKYEHSFNSFLLGIQFPIFSSKSLISEFWQWKPVIPSPYLHYHVVPSSLSGPGRQNDILLQTFMIERGVGNESYRMYFHWRCLCTKATGTELCFKSTRGQKRETERRKSMSVSRESFCNQGCRRVKNK